MLFAVTVAILGFITPGYSHLNYTISRLAIETYGWVQIINFLQLAVALYLTGLRLSAVMHKNTIILTVFTICSMFLLIAAAFPTDPIENAPLDLSLLSPTGLVHSSVVFLFLLLSPLGIIILANEFYKLRTFRVHAIITLIAGFSAFLGSIAWFVLYFLGLYLEYRGIFQKVIALPVLIWLTIVNMAIYKPPK